MCLQFVSLNFHNLHFSPHLCVGFLFLVLYPAVRPPPPVVSCPHTTCSHRTCPHTTYPHTTCSHTTCPHTTCSHTTCPHTSCHHTTCHHTTCTHQLVLTQLVLTKFVHTQLAQTQLVLTQLAHTQLVLTHGTWRHVSSLCVAGVARMALGWLRWRAWAGVERGTPRLLAWQAWHLETSTFVSRAGVVLGDIDFHFCVAGVARMALGWLRWRAWAGVERGDAAAVGVAGVVLGDIDFHFCQAWHVWHWAGSGGALGPGWNAGTPRLLAWQAWHLVTSTFNLRGRRGTWRHVSSLCVAGVAHGSGGALGPEWNAGTLRLLAWQAWHLETSTFVSRGRRGTW